MSRANRNDVFRFVQQPFCALSLAALVCSVTVWLQTAGLRAAEASRPVAAVLARDGGATIADASGKSRPARTYGTIYAQERLEVPAGAYLVVGYRSDGRLERLNGPVSATCTESGCQPPGLPVSAPGKVAPRKVAGLVAQLPPVLVAGASVLRGGTDPVLNPIKKSRIATTKPPFSWPPISGAREYTLTVRNDGDDTLVWSAVTAKTEVAYGAKDPLQPDGAYSWSVIGKSDRGSLAEYKGDFTVASEPEMIEAAQLKEMMDNSDPLPLAVAAAEYHRLGMMAEATKAFERLARQRPREASVQAALAELYDAAGRSKDAVKAHEAAKKLGAESPGMARRLERSRN